MSNDDEIQDLRDRLEHASEAIRLLADMVGDLLDVAAIEDEDNRQQYDEEIARVLELAAMIG